MARVLHELRTYVREMPGTSGFLMGFSSTLRVEIALQAFGPL
jgi:hypothetical protein